MMTYYKLDNPVWYSLSETHKQFALEYSNAKFYKPDYCPFGGFISSDNSIDVLGKYASLIDNFYIVGEQPVLPAPLSIKKELVCLQMICNEKIKIELRETILKLNQEHCRTLYEVVNRVQPGYFREKTNLLGDYFGIFKNDKLVAVTGERMKMDDLTEVSAVVTDPHHTGKGYAKQLIAHVTNNIFNQNKTPYLHVAETNLGAIQLYEKLGFKLRRKISFWNIVSE